MPLMSDKQPPEVLQPGEKPPDFPAALMPPQLSATLIFWLRAVAAMRRNQLNAVLFQEIIIELVAAICFIANEFFRLFDNEKTVQGRFLSASFTSCGEALARQDDDRKAEVLFLTC